MTDAGVDVVDVVVVGGGIGGAAFAKAAADAGLSVLVLERQVNYRDKVRGEYMNPWGVAEARRLGVEDALLEGGGTWITQVVAYDELVRPEDAEANPLLITKVRPDLPGALDVGHPRACQALADAAQVAGARFVVGVGEVEVSAGSRPTVRYELDDVDHEVRCRLIVGADGRASTVRRQLRMALRQTEPRTMGGGILVDGLEAWPSDRASAGTEGDLFYLVFPRADGSARLYQVFDIAQRGRFTGPNRERELLDSFRMDCLPLGENVAAASPAGPVAFYPLNDSLVDDPCVPGAVLIGDAAGWSDPIIGEGLSGALRDARTVVEVITRSNDWSPASFRPYVEERRERMRRFMICGQLQTGLQCDFTPAGRRHRSAVSAALRDDPLLAAATIVTMFGGPDLAPVEAFQPENITRIKQLV